MIVRVYTTNGHFDEATNVPDRVRRRIEEDLDACLKQSVELSHNGGFSVRPSNRHTLKVGSATVVAHHITGIDEFDPDG